MEDALDAWKNDQTLTQDVGAMNDAYAEGSNAAPDCASTDGRAPDPASPKKQSVTCAVFRRIRQPPEKLATG